MQAFEISTTVEDEGQVRVAGVPFAPGTEVDVTISPKRKSAENFAAAWQRVTCLIRDLPQLSHLGDDEIQQEIDNHRTGK